MDNLFGWFFCKQLGQVTPFYFLFFPFVISPGLSNILEENNSFFFCFLTESQVEKGYCFWIEHIINIIHTSLDDLDYWIWN